MKKIRGEETAEFELTLEEVIEKLDCDLAKEIATAVLTHYDEYGGHSECDLQYELWVKVMAKFFDVEEREILGVGQIARGERHHKKMTGFSVRVRRSVE